MPGGPNFWPWGYGVTQNPNTNNPQTPESYGPYLPPTIDAGEWSFQRITDVPRSVATSVANASRLLFSSNASPVKQAEPSNTGPAWYNIPGRISAAASAVGEGIQSTLLKVLILVVVVGAMVLFGMSYMSTKGAQLAK